MDVRLHGETQLATLREMKAIRPWIKSIIITAYPQEETGLEAQKLGIVDSVVKPIDMDDLQRIIHGTIESIYKDNINALDINGSIESSTEDLIPGIKKSFAISRDNLALMVENLLKETEVVGVKAKQGNMYMIKFPGFMNSVSITMLPSLHLPGIFFLKEKLF
jgi:CheY-like chemotaxis protein